MRDEPRRRVHPEIRRRAQELRHALTQAEQELWGLLRNRNLGGFKFRRQHPIGPYIADFYCPESRLVIELDGSAHEGRQEYDTARSAWLEYRGYRVIRFTNALIQQCLDEVAREILLACMEEQHGNRE